MKKFRDKMMLKLVQHAASRQHHSKSLLGRLYDIADDYAALVQLRFDIEVDISLMRRWKRVGIGLYSDELFLVQDRHKYEAHQIKLAWFIRNRPLMITDADLELCEDLAEARTAYGEQVDAFFVEKYPNG